MALDISEEDLNALHTELIIKEEDEEIIEDAPSLPGWKLIALYKINLSIIRRRFKCFIQ